MRKTHSFSPLTIWLVILSWLGVCYGFAVIMCLKPKVAPIERFSLESFLTHTSSFLLRKLKGGFPPWFFSGSHSHRIPHPIESPDFIKSSKSITFSSAEVTHTLVPSHFAPAMHLGYTCRYLRVPCAGCRMRLWAWTSLTSKRFLLMSNTDSPECKAPVFPHLPHIFVM